METIRKSIGQGWGKGGIYYALAYDPNDKYGGLKIKSICTNFTAYDETTGDGRVCFGNRDMYVAPYRTEEIGGANELDIVASDGLWLFSDHIYLVGEVHYYGEIHETSTAEFDVLLTNPTESINAIHALINAGVSWTNGVTSGNLVAVRGMVAVSGAGNDIVSATGVWAGLDFADAIGAGSGLTCALNAEVSSDNASTPNAIVYIQSLPSTGANFNDVPYIAFTEVEGSGDIGSNVLFSLGHQPAGSGKNVTSGTSGDLLYNDTIRIIANGTAKYIPLSSNEATFTTTRAIITTFAATAIDIGACVTGILITNASTYAIQIVTDGRFAMGTMDVGIPVATGALNAMEVHTEPGADMTPDGTGISCGIRSRYQISTAQTTQISMIALEGRLRVKADLADGAHAGVSGTIEAGLDPASTEVAFSGTSTTQRSAGNFCVELGEYCTLADGGWLTGVTIDSSTHGAVDVTANSTTYAGLRIKTSSGKEPWTYGIHIGDDDVVTGISIGTTATAGINFTNGGATGIDFNGTWTGSCITIGENNDEIVCSTGVWAMQIRTQYPAETGSHVPVYIKGQYTYDGAGTGSLHTLIVHAEIEGDLTENDTNAYLVAVHGRAQVTGIVDNDFLMVTGIHAQILDGGTYTAVSHICALWADWQLEATVSSGITDLFYMSNNQSVLTVDNAIWLYGPLVTNFVRFESCFNGGMVSNTSADAIHATLTKKIKINIDNVTYYLLASTTPVSSGA